MKKRCRALALAVSQCHLHGLVPRAVRFVQYNVRYQPHDKGPRNGGQGKGSLLVDMMKNEGKSIQNQ